MSGIAKLRRLVDWANWQEEDLWLPFEGAPPTLAQIERLCDLCQEHSVGDVDQLPHSVFTEWEKSCR